MASALRMLFIAGAGALGYNRLAAGDDEKPRSKLVTPALAITAGVVAFLAIKKLKR